MKNICSVSVIILFLIIGKCFGQVNYPDFHYVSYPGGDDSLNAFLKTNLKYPQSALNDSITGTAFLVIEIDTTGKMNDIKILKGVRDDINKEAIRVVSLIPRWNPYIINGKKEKVKFNLPIRFKIIK